MDYALIYCALLVGIVIGAMLAGLWFERRPRVPDWFRRFERDCIFTRPQAMGTSHKEIES